MCAGLRKEAWSPPIPYIFRPIPPPGPTPLSPTPAGRPDQPPTAASRSPPRTGAPTGPIAATAPPRARMTEAQGRRGSSMVTYAMLLSTLASCWPILMRMYNRFGRFAPRLGAISLDDGDLYRGVLYPRESHVLGAANGPSTQWFVFYYNPECGGCRRLRSTYHALGSLTNATEHLRFGEFDCRANRVICERLGAAKQPLLRLHREVPGRKKGMRKREVVATYEGPNIGYALLSWIKGLQAEGALSGAIAWPDDADLQEEVMRVKRRGRMKVENLVAAAGDDPSGYIHDGEVALRAALDVSAAAFPERAGGAADGAAVAAVLALLRAAAVAFPAAEVRQSCASLLSHLEDSSSGAAPSRSSYRAMVEGGGLGLGVSHGLLRWCRGGGESGVGGRPCATWLLFHGLLANAGESDAQEVLRAVAQWTEALLPCRECAEHFGAMWRARERAGGADHEDAVLWLWRAHNAVNERLYAEQRAEGQAPAAGKRQWPPKELCPACYGDAVRLGGAEPNVGSWEEAQWRPGFVFAFLQQYFCDGSDTITCASFYDPSGYRAYKESAAEL